LVTRNGTPESAAAVGGPAKLTGTPSRVLSSVSAQPHEASASASTDARATKERFTRLPDEEMGRAGNGAPQR